MKSRLMFSIAVHAEADIFLMDDIFAEWVMNGLKRNLKKFSKNLL